METCYLCVCVATLYELEIDFVLLVYPAILLG